MRKLLLTIITSLTCIIALADETITIGATPVPHAQMLQIIKPILAKQGYDLKIIEFTDYLTPNLATTQKKLDANFTVHQPYLDQYNEHYKADLVALVKVHLEPMGVYADKTTEAKFSQTKKITDIKKDSKIGIPNDPTNEGRALSILQANGILKINSGIANPTKKDIISNPYNLQIMELDPAMLPRMLGSHQISLAVINSNFALQAHLNPKRDAVLLESSNSPFVNIVAVRKEELDQPKIKALAKAMNSQQMKDFINQKYDGALIPSF